MVAAASVSAPAVNNASRPGAGTRSPPRRPNATRPDRPAADARTPGPSPAARYMLRRDRLAQPVLRPATGATARIDPAVPRREPRVPDHLHVAYAVQQTRMRPPTSAPRSSVELRLAPSRPADPAGRRRSPPRDLPGRARRSGSHPRERASPAASSISSDGRTEAQSRFGLAEDDLALEDPALHRLTARCAPRARRSPVAGRAASAGSPDRGCPRGGGPVLSRFEDFGMSLEVAVGAGGELLDRKALRRAARRNRRPRSPWRCTALRGSQLLQTSTPRKRAATAAGCEGIGDVARLSPGRTPAISSGASRAGSSSGNRDRAPERPGTSRTGGTSVRRRGGPAGSTGASRRPLPGLAPAACRLVARRQIRRHDQRLLFVVAVHDDVVHHVPRPRGRPSGPEIVQDQNLAPCTGAEHLDLALRRPGSRRSPAAPSSSSRCS